VTGHRRRAADLPRKMLRSVTRNQPKRHAGKVRRGARIVGRFRPRLHLRLLLFFVYFQLKCKVSEFFMGCDDDKFAETRRANFNKEFSGKDLNVI
jgi:hypothetical protein